MKRSRDLDRCLWANRAELASLGTALSPDFLCFEIMEILFVHVGRVFCDPRLKASQRAKVWALLRECQSRKRKS